MKFRPKDHVLQRLDGRPLSCGRCRKGVWEIAKHGYDHFNHQYQKKRKEMRKQRMTEELDVLKEIVSDQKSIFKRERKGHRLRQAQEDKLSEMYRVGKEEAAAKIKTELDLYFGPMTTPLHFDPKQLTLERGDNGQPLIPPPVDETGRAVAMFSFDFNRNCIMCRACNVFWNSGPVFGQRVVVNAYAPVGPVIDPEAAARRTVKRIHDSKIHAKLMEKLRLEALAKAKIKLDYFKFDLIVLDVMMPGQNGFELTKEIKKNSSVPIILLTAKGEVENRIQGLELGADDYLSKPFEPKELLLRIKNIVKKSKKINFNKFNKIGEAKVDLNKMSIQLKNRVNKINNAEKKILVEMLSNPGKTYSRIQIGEISNISQERSIDVMITRLRQKIEVNPKNPKYLQTIRGSGYVLWVE